MTSSDFNRWAEEYVDEYRKSGKLDRKIIKGYLQKEIEGYQNVLIELNRIDSNK